MYYLTYNEGPIGFFKNIDKDDEGIVWAWCGAFSADNYPGLMIRKLSAGMSVAFPDANTYRWDRKGMIVKVNKVTLKIEDNETGEIRTLRIDR